MAGEGILRIKVLGDISDFQKGMQGIGGDLTKLGSQLQSAGRQITMLTAPLLAVGAGAIKVGTEFDSSFAKIEGLVGVASRDMGELREGVLRLAGTTSKAPLELADALFFITSAGLRGAEALDVLEISAKGSAAGLGETKDIANLLTSVINAYGAENITAARAGDILTATIREGKLETDALAGVMGPLLPLASKLGIGFEDLGGQYAAMSRTGAEAAGITTSLQAIMTTLLKPSVGAQKALEGVGLSFGQLREVAAGPEGLIGVMRLLEERFAGNDEELVKVIPNVRAFRGVMSILAQDAGIVDTVIGNVADSTGFLNTAFDVSARTTEFKFNQAMANAQVALLEVWETLRGPVSDALDGLSKLLSDAATWFKGLDEGTKSTVVTIGALAVALGPVLIILGVMASGLGAIINVLSLFVGGLVKASAALIGWIANLVTGNAAVTTMGGEVGRTTGGLRSFGDSLKGAGVAAGLFAAGVMIANEAGKAMTAEYNKAAEAIKGMTDATPEQITQLRESGRVMVERADALKFMGFWDTEASIALREAGQAALEQADALEASGKAAAEAGAIAKGTAGDWDHLADRVGRIGAEMRDNLTTTLRQLGPEFELTAQSAQVLADRFGTTAATVTEVWSGVEAEFSAQTEAIRGHLSTLPAGFQLTSEAAQEMAVLLGVSAGDVQRVFGEMGGAVGEAAVDTQVAAEKIDASLSQITGALSGLGSSADSAWQQFKSATKDGTEDPQARIEKLQERLRKLSDEDLTKMGPAALAAWFEARAATEQELGGLMYFVENQSDIIATLMPDALADSNRDWATEWQNTFDISTRTVEGIPGAISPHIDSAVSLVAAIPGRFGESLQAGAPLVTAGAGALTAAADTAWAPLPGLAQDTGEAGGGAFAGGIDSQERATAAAGLDLQQAAWRQFESLRNLAEGAGYGAGIAYAKGIRQAVFIVEGGAAAIRNAAKRVLDVTAWAYQSGLRTIRAYADGILAGRRAAESAARTVANSVQRILKASSPPGPASPLHHIDDWGFNTIMAWGDGALKAVRPVVSRLQAGMKSLSGAVDMGFAAPGLGVATLTPAAAALSGGRTVVAEVHNHNHFHGPIYGGPAGLDQLVRDIEDRRRQTRRGGGQLTGGF